MTRAAHRRDDDSVHLWRAALVHNVVEEQSVAVQDGAVVLGRLVARHRSWRYCYISLIVDLHRTKRVTGNRAVRSRLSAGRCTCPGLNANAHTQKQRLPVLQPQMLEQVL